ncbi:tellurite resistance TerB family protein [Oscillatoria sp. FACHB-1406]|uniref:tellurite resistance TerB family protein n=1 Tax=Oscillatoria sp. FACHB-1406 TaxID=2692846 RepID=UPI001684CB73|nr:tellurite resistance TerB family protein [Oscillatoria sp. FACHB-1406]MBD2579989.1 tellurite resistance TerB family protein [Oscillatoria sp. FACHB-1406]
MSIFDEFRQAGALDSQITLGPAEGFGAIMLLAIAADGRLSQDEMALLNTTLGRMKLFQSYPWEVMGRMFENLSEILHQKGPQALFGAAMATLPHELYDTAFAIATDLVLVDGEVTPEEEHLLNSLCRALDLPDDLVQSTIAVMLIKNKA